MGSALRVRRTVIRKSRVMIHEAAAAPLTPTLRLLPLAIRSSHKHNVSVRITYIARSPECEKRSCRDRDLEEAPIQGEISEGKTTVEKLPDYRGAEFAGGLPERVGEGWWWSEICQSCECREYSVTVTLGELDCNGRPTISC